MKEFAVKNNISISAIRELEGKSGDLNTESGKLFKANLQSVFGDQYSDLIQFLQDSYKEIGASMLTHLQSLNLPKTKHP